MSTSLRILLLEDSPADAKLIERELFREGFNFSLVRVGDEDRLRGELMANRPDLVLSERRLHALDGFRALAVARELCPQLPFIFVSGSNDQQLVCDMYEAGATDYVFKRDLQDLRSTVIKASGVEPEPNLTAATADKESPGLLPPLFVPACGYLSLCPQCHQARDEAGQIVPMEDYCFHRLESLVMRKLCEDCSHAILTTSKPQELAPAQLQLVAD